MNVLRTHRLWIGGAATLVVVAALLIVVFVVRSGGGSSSGRVGAPARVQTTAPARATTKPARHTKRKAVRRSRSLPRPTNRVASLPLARSRWIPWHDDGTSSVADTRHAWLAVYSHPRARRPTLLLHNPDRVGSPRVLLVHSERRKWVRVYLPNRPDGRTGWVKRAAVRLLTDPYRIVVRLRAHRLQLWKGAHVVLRAKTVVGKSSTPTPRGMFFIVDLLRPPNPDGAYGPFAFNLSAHSRVLRTFAGGDGVVAIHGTDEPWLIGQSASHGCIRVRNAIIRRLAKVLPLGTPVQIRA